jgi:uncharacterized cupredoxin-like copper-binding protein
MKRVLLYLPATVMVVLSSVALAACGSDDNNAENPPASTQAAKRTGGAAVRATEGEWKVAALPATATSGPVKFTVSNQGKEEHEFVVLRTDRRAADLGKGKEAAEPGNVGEIEDIEPGHVLSKTIRLQPGHYALICNLPGHYKAGMHTDFQVR